MCNCLLALKLSISTLLSAKKHIQMAYYSDTPTQACLFVVALNPFKIPARAAMSAPVQTVIKYCRFGAIFLTHSMTSSPTSSDPRPPGIKSTSRSGADCIVNCGIICCARTLPTSPGVAGLTGSNVGAMIESVTF
jgi:hypothetical protein